MRVGERDKGLDFIQQREGYDSAQRVKAALPGHSDVKRAEPSSIWRDVWGQGRFVNDIVLQRLRMLM